MEQQLKCNYPDCLEGVMAGSSYCEQHTCLHAGPNNQRCVNPVARDSYHFCYAHLSDIGNVLIDIGNIGIFGIVSAQYRQDLREYWTRTNLFLIIQSAFFAAFGAIYAEATKATKGMEPHDRYVLGALSVVALIFSLMWWIINSSSIAWIKRWREQVRIVDKYVAKPKLHSYLNLEEQSSKGHSPLPSPSCSIPNKPRYHASETVIFLIILLLIVWALAVVVFLFLWQIPL